MVSPVSRVLVYRRIAEMFMRILHDFHRLDGVMAIVLCYRRVTLMVS